MLVLLSLSSVETKGSQKLRFLHLPPEEGLALSMATKL